MIRTKTEELLAEKLEKLDIRFDTRDYLGDFFQRSARRPSLDLVYQAGAPGFMADIDKDNLTFLDGRTTGYLIQNGNFDELVRFFTPVDDECTFLWEFRGEQARFYVNELPDGSKFPDPQNPRLLDVVRFARQNGDRVGEVVAKIASVMQPVGEAYGSSQSTWD